MSEECAELIEVAEGPTICSPEIQEGRHPVAVQEEAGYSYKVHVDISYDQGMKAIKRFLVEQGLEVVMEIDAQKMLDESPGVGSRPYTILGVCDSKMIQKALEIDRDAGLLLPCNLVVYEESGGTILEAVDTIKHFAMSGHKSLQELGRDIKERLQTAIDRAASSSV